MPTTSNYALRYPALTDPPNGPTQIQALATDTDSTIKARIPQEFQAFASSDVTVGTAEADLPGASVTFTAANANSIAIVDMSWEVRITATGSSYIRGRWQLDGVTQPRESLFLAQAAESRATVSLRQRVVLGAAGTHTVKLRGIKDLAGGSAIIVGGTTGGSQVSVTLYD